MARSPGTWRALREPARPTVRPRARAEAAKAASLPGAIRSGSDPPPLPKVSNITPDAPICVATSDRIDLGRSIGEQNEDETDFGRKLRQHVEAAFRVFSRKKTELDVIDAKGRRRRHRGANGLALERQVADRRADRHSAADRSDAGGDGIGGKGAESALAGIFEIDDIGAGADRHLGFGGIAHTCQEQGHRQALAGDDRQSSAAISGTAN